MKTIFYLAMTETEISSCSDLPDKTAWMACHFSPYGTGLSNLPTELPPDSMVILNDRIPIRGHDAGLIGAQLESLQCSLLLDLQRPKDPETENLVKVVLAHTKHPTAVSAPYASDLDCPVFLPIPYADEDPLDMLSQWEGREIWLDVSPGAVQYTVTKTGARRLPTVISSLEIPSQQDKPLLCRYQIEPSEEDARFTMYRTPEDIAQIMLRGRTFGVTRAVGLYQEWKAFL